MPPKYVKAVLWSYDTDAIDLQKHRQLVVSQVLNFGTKKATDWLFKVYGKDTVREIASEIPKVNGIKSPWPYGRWFWISQQ